MFQRILVWLCLFLLPLMADEAEWAQWLGKNRDGKVTEVSILTSWPEGGLEKVWKKNMGDGFSAPSIRDGRLYTMYSNGYDDFLVCLNAENGDEIWRERVDRSINNSLGGDGPRSTPTVSEKLVVTVGTYGQLVAADRMSGKMLWKVNLMEEFNAKVNKWGYSCSPLIYNNQVIVEVGGGNHALVSFDLQSGKVKWKSGSDPLGYSSPIIASLDGEEQLVAFTGNHLRGMNPNTGEQLWGYAWKTSYNVNAATPVMVGDDQVFISSGYGTGGALVKVSKQGNQWEVTEVWKNKVMKNHFSTSVVVGDLIYGFSDGILTAMNAKDGKRVWTQRGFGKGTLIAVGTYLLVLGDRGDLALVNTTANSYQEVSRFRALDGGLCWTNPVIVEGRLYLRSLNEMISYDIADKN